MHPHPRRVDGDAEAFADLLHSHVLTFDHVLVDADTLANAPAVFGAHFFPVQLHGTPTTKYLLLGLALSASFTREKRRASYTSWHSLVGYSEATKPPEERSA